MSDQQNYEEVDILMLTNEDGVEEKFEIIYEFEHETNGYRYLLLTPFSEEADGEVEVYPVRCKIGDDEETIETLETDEEWEMVEQVLQSLEEQDENEGSK